MKIHIHIPTLLEFSLDSACDDVVRHGMGGLKKLVPLPLYLRCIMTFAEKHSLKHRNKMYVYKLIRSDPSCKTLDSCGCYHPFGENSCVCVLDHVDLDGDISYISSIIDGAFQECNVDTDGVIACVHRFAVRCEASRKHALLLDVFNYAVQYSNADSAVKQVLERYVRGSFDHSVFCQQLHDKLDNGETLNRLDLKDAIGRGDIDAIRLVVDKLSYTDRHVGDNDMKISDLDVDACESMLSLGVLQPGHRYKVHHARSLSVLKWFVQHDMLANPSYLLDQCAKYALGHHGESFDILRYIIEDLNVKVHGDVVIRHHRTVLDPFDLSVMSYLVAHGADINAVDDNGDNVAVYAPMYLRYWLDMGLKFNKSSDVPFDILKSCMEPLHDCMFGIDGEGIKVLIDALDFNVKTRDSDGNTLLHIACDVLRFDIVKALVECGSDVYAKNNRCHNVADMVVLHPDYDDVQDIIDYLQSHGCVQRGAIDFRYSMRHVCSDVIVI